MQHCTSGWGTRLHGSAWAGGGTAQGTLALLCSSAQGLLLPSGFPWCLLQLWGDKITHLRGAAPGFPYSPISIPVLHPASSLVAWAHTVTGDLSDPGVSTSGLVCVLHLPSASVLQAETSFFCFLIYEQLLPTCSLFFSSHLPDLE